MLAEMIREELDDAAKYAKMAVQYKETNRRLGEMFYNLSRQELEHANLEHEQAVQTIRESGQKAPAAMQAVWDWEHESQIEETAKIRQLLEMFKQ